MVGNARRSRPTAGWTPLRPRSIGRHGGAELAEKAPEQLGEVTVPAERDDELAELLFVDRPRRDAAESDPLRGEQFDRSEPGDELARPTRAEPAAGRTATAVDLA